MSKHQDLRVSIVEALQVLPEEILESFQADAHDGDVGSH